MPTILQNFCVKHFVKNTPFFQNPCKVKTKNTPFIWNPWTMLHPEKYRHSPWYRHRAWVPSFIWSWGAGSSQDKIRGPPPALYHYTVETDYFHQILCQDAVPLVVFGKQMWLISVDTAMFTHQKLTISKVTVASEDWVKIDCLRFLIVSENTIRGVPHENKAVVVPT